MRPFGCLPLSLLLALPVWMRADGPFHPDSVEVFFSPKGGCTEAIIGELGKAKKTVLVQSYSFTSAPIAQALVAAHMYANGDGVPKDETEAVKWYRKAAERGVALAQSQLGWMYENGSGVPKDPVEAVKWCRKAAEQGYAAAQHNLGVMYYNGTGVIKNPAQAHAWWSIAGSRGFKEAKKNLVSLEKEMTAEQKAEAMKLERELFARLRKK